MAFYYCGNGSFENSYITNTSISNCIITTSSLDMNLENITSVKNPILPQDAVTKDYCDNNSTFNPTSVDLSGTTATLISSNFIGIFTIRVQNLISNGPCATFNVIKNNVSKYAQITRTSASAGIGGTTLALTWDIGSPIYLYKTNSLYDGAYSITIF